MLKIIIIIASYNVNNFIPRVKVSWKIVGSYIYIYILSMWKLTLYYDIMFYGTLFLLSKSYFPILLEPIFSTRKQEPPSKMKSKVWSHLQGKKLWGDELSFSSACIRGGYLGRCDFVALLVLFNMILSNDV